MGCDIHIFMERQNGEGKWEDWKEMPEELIPDGRNYFVFSFLFGFRGSDPGLFKLRGWPEERFFTDDYEDNCYGHSYLTYEESQKIKWPENIENTEFAIFCDYVWPRMRIYNFEKNEYFPTRMLVCFDC